jgi:hypothetical protein
MQHRYGLDRRPVGRWIAVSLLIAAFVVALGFVAHAITKASVDGTLITWKVVGSDRVDARIQVRRVDDVPVTCVLRAQDFDRADVGYAVVDVPAGGLQVELPYSMRTLAPATITELLGCSADGRPNVTPPQFPPGVVAPAQPY